MFATLDSVPGLRLGSLDGTPEEQFGTVSDVLPLADGGVAVLDGQGYIRTGGTNWGDNVSRDPLLVLRIEGTEYPLRAEFVEDKDVRATIKLAFKKKYGVPDALISFVRGDRPKMMRLLAR